MSRHAISAVEGIATIGRTEKIAQRAVGANPERPLAIDLCCGLGGWAEGLLAEGYNVIGFDIEKHDYGTGAYPGQLVIQDVLTLHGSQFRNAALIVASPPCQRYSYMAMPWSRAKEQVRRYQADIGDLNALFDVCFRIQREASEAAGHHIPMVVENVKGAQRWVGRAKWHYGSFYLWGDVPALMSPTLHRKVNGFNFHQHEKTGKPGGSFQSAAVKLGGSWFHGYRKGQGPRNHGSNSYARKAASAQIAKIPFALARYIAEVYR